MRIGKASGFNVKGRVSTEWLLTEFPDDRAAHSIAEKDFMKWEAAKSFHGPTSRPISPTSEPIRVF